jgi:hypothetical protein
MHSRVLSNSPFDPSSGSLRVVALWNQATFCDHLWTGRFQTGWGTRNLSIRYP